MSTIDNQVKLDLVATIKRLAQQLNGKTAPNSLTLETYTAATLVSRILEGTAANASLLEGKTYAEVVDFLGGQGPLVADVQAAIETYMARRDNPHQVTAEQVGLGAVVNARVASTTEAVNGTAGNYYLTPALAKSTIDAVVDVLVGAAPENMNQLNELSAAMGDDPNLSVTLMGMIAGLATHTEAEAMVAAFAARTDNPHQVTKEQIGLGQVENFAVADAVQAADVTNNSNYLTPVVVKGQVDTLGYATQTDLADFWTSVTTAFDEEADAIAASNTAPAV